MRLFAYIVRNEDELRRVVNGRGTDGIEFREIEGRYSTRWGSTVCRISVDKVRCVRRVCGGYRTAPWVGAYKSVK